MSDEDNTPDMTVSLGDCEIYAECAHCAKSFGSIRPNQSLDVLALKWEHHTMLDGCMS